jgi:hypothetical protein
VGEKEKVKDSCLKFGNLLKRLIIHFSSKYGDMGHIPPPAHSFFVFHDHLIPFHTALVFVAAGP